MVSMFIRTSYSTWLIFSKEAKGIHSTLDTGLLMVVECVWCEAGIASERDG